MKIISLASGSRGNCTYLYINTKHILIDVGISMKQINHRLLIHVGVDLDDIDTIFITHAHSDHIKSIPTINKNYPHIKFIIPHKAIKDITAKLKYHIPSECKVLIDKRIDGKAFNVTPKHINHDEFTYAYIFKDLSNNETYAHIPDNGGLSYKRFDEFKDMTYYSIESNHDLTMQIFDTKRNPLLKRRVLGYYGHQDNVSAIKFAIECVGSNTKGIIFTHLSEDCNDPQIAKDTHLLWLEIFGEKTKFKNIIMRYATQNDVVTLL